MKELSIEEKARRYDEVIRESSKIIDFCAGGANISECVSVKATIEQIFPELKESEDKIIINALKSGFKLLESEYKLKGLGGIKFKKMLAWLEKQKTSEEILILKDQIESLHAAIKAVKETHRIELEKQAEHAKFCDSIHIGDKVTRNEDGVLVNLSQLDRVAKKQGEQELTVIIPKFKAGQTIKYIGDFTIYPEVFTVSKVGEAHYLDKNGFTIPIKNQDQWELVEQKPAWSEEDESLCMQIEGLLKVCLVKNLLSFDLYKKMCDLLKSLKDRVQPKQEWSEEDEEAINIGRLACLRFEEEAVPTGFSISFSEASDRLKSLRPQSHWKPSKEQIEGWVKEYRDSLPFIGDYESYGDALAHSYKLGLINMSKIYEEKN